MITFENTLNINQPVETVFAFMTNFENIPRWNYYVRDVQQIVGEAPVVGAAYHQVRQHDRQVYLITKFQPNRAVTVKTTPDSEPAFERSLTFAAVDGGTQVTDSWSLELGANPLIEKFGKGRVRAAVADNLGKLKELLETGSTRLQDGRVSRL